VGCSRRHCALCAAVAAHPLSVTPLHRNALRLGHLGQRHLEDSTLESRFRLARIHVPRQGDGPVEGTAPDLAAVVVALLFLFLVASLALDGDGALVDGNLQVVLADAGALRLDQHLALRA